eukprot:7327864-Alexandrium_andersonii.AAC.1
MELKHDMEGRPFCKIPADKGATIPLKSWKASHEFKRRMLGTGRYEAPGTDGGKMYGFIRTPQEVRETGMAVDRATE